MDTSIPTENIKTYVVLINGEEQYSIWPSRKEIPNGWSETGKSGSKEECLSYIEAVWVDMRPLSLRRKLQGQS
jgi:MbtH protein